MSLVACVGGLALAMRVGAEGRRQRGEHIAWADATLGGQAPLSESAGVASTPPGMAPLGERGRTGDVRGEPAPHRPDRLPEIDQSALRMMNPLEGVLLALSAEEAAWLDQHGYPSPEQWRDRDAVATAELERRVASGDMIAKLMLGERLARAGDFTRSQALFSEAQVAGSVYASYLAAQGLAAEMTRRGKDASIGGANGPSMSMIQLAAILGDHRAGSMVGMLSLRGDEGWQFGSSIGGAFAMLDSINAQRRARGLMPLQPRVRPGGADWTEAALNQTPVRPWRRGG